MQTNNMALKRRLLFDNEEFVGLVETGELLDQKELIQVPSFRRTVDVTNGTSKLEPLPAVYKVERETDTYVYLKDWFEKNERHDLTIINTDGHGVEVNRTVWPQCECSQFNERAYNAGGIEFFGVGVQFTTADEPIRSN